MTRPAILATAAALILASCGGGGSTPESVLETLKSAVKSKDWAGAYGCMAPSELKKLEDKESQDRKGMIMGLTMMGMKAEEIQDLSGKDLFIKMMEKMSEKGSPDIQEMEEFEVVGQAEIEGDNAKLKVKVKGKEKTLRFVKEEGAWYLKN